MARRSGFTTHSCLLRLKTRAHPGLTAALALSILLHAAVASMVTGGHAGSVRPVEFVPALSVRLVEPAPAEVTPSAWVGEARTAAIQPLAPPANAKSRSTHAPISAAPAIESVSGSGAAVEGPDLTYYPAKQLDVYPSLASAIELRSLTDGVTGSIARAQFLLLIDETGVVKEASVVEGEPAMRFEAARLAFLAARFTPAYRNGRAVRSRVLIEVNY